MTSNNDFRPTRGGVFHRPTLTRALNDHSLNPIIPFLNQQCLPLLSNRLLASIVLDLRPYSYAQCEPELYRGQLVWPNKASLLYVLGTRSRNSTPHQRPPHAAQYPHPRF